MREKALRERESASEREDDKLAPSSSSSSSLQPLSLSLSLLFPLVNFFASFPSLFSLFFLLSTSSLPSLLLFFLPLRFFLFFFRSSFLFPIRFSHPPFSFPSHLPQNLPPSFSCCNHSLPHVALTLFSFLLHFSSLKAFHSKSPIAPLVSCLCLSFFVLLCSSCFFFLFFSFFFLPLLPARLPSVFSLASLCVCLPYTRRFIIVVVIIIIITFLLSSRRKKKFCPSISLFYFISGIIFLVKNFISASWCLFFHYSTWVSLFWSLSLTLFFSSHPLASSLLK